MWEVIFLSAFSLVFPSFYSTHPPIRQLLNHYLKKKIRLCWVFLMACSMWFLDQGRNLGPGHWEHGVSAISEKSLKLFFSENLSWPLIRTVKLYISNLAFGVSMIALPPISRGFPGGSGVKRPPASVGGAGDSVSIPGSGRSLGEENGNPLQCSCLENPMDRGAWRATVHGVAKGQSGPSP